MRIHAELREADAPASQPAPRQLPAVIVQGPVLAADARPEGPAPRGQELHDPQVHDAQLHDHATGVDGLRRYALLLGGAVVVIALIVGVVVQRQVSAQLEAATSRAAAAERQVQATSDAAARQMATTRADADRQIAEARQAALKAEIVSNVLAAPDLIRFNLVGSGDSSRAYAQLLFSRTRGMVLSGARLPPPSAGSAYQLWLLTDAEPVSGGLLALDSTGRVTLATDTTPSIPRRMTGAVVTQEPAAGASIPSGITVLARAQQ
jgi:hypothetical protein